MMHWNWNNFVTTPQRWAATWLRRRGWVVFYLDQECRSRCESKFCWLNLYYDGEARAQKP